MNHRIIQCQCGVTVEDYGTFRVEWFTGIAHDCRRNAEIWVDAIADDALSGDREADRLVAEAVDSWLRS